MPARKKWNFRRWRRRWNDRFARLALRSRIWFDRHVLSYKKRREWRRRWKERSDRFGQRLENVGFKILPRKPDAEPDTAWTRFVKRLNDFYDRRVYPPATRVRHAEAFRLWWAGFSEPVRQANARVIDWLDKRLFGLTREQLRETYWNWKGATGLVFLLALLCAVPSWLVPQWRLHNEAKWSAQSRLLLSRGYTAQAYQLAARVLRRDDQNADAARVIADMLERQNLSEAIVWRRKVVDADGSVSNQLALAATAIRFERPPSPTAKGILDDLSGPMTNSVPYRLVQAQFEIKSGDLAGAETNYLFASELEPTNAEIKLALAVLRLQTRDAAKLSAAEQDLKDLATQTNIAVRALRPLVLLETLRGHYDKALQYSEQILGNESSTFEDRLAHLGVLTRKSDPQRDKFLHTLQDQVSANPVFIAQLSSWMTANGLRKEALDWLAGLPPKIQTAEPVLLATADAYVAREDWSGMEQFLQKQGWGTIEYVRQAMLARAYRGLGSRREFEESFRRSLDLASGMSLRLTSLTKLVSRWGWDRQVEELLWTIFERFPDETWAADSLLKTYFDRGDTEGLKRVFTLQLKRSPKDVALKNNLAMVLLLLKTDLPKAHQLAQESYQSNPQSAVNASTYAFSLAIQGKADEGMKILESLGPETLKAPSIATYYVILADAAGDTAAAKRFVRFTQQARLLPEEKALLDRARKKL